MRLQPATKLDRSSPEAIARSIWRFEMPEAKTASSVL
jgi:hypothetical protein